MSRFSDDTSKFLYKVNNIKKMRKKCLESIKYIEDSKEQFDKKTFNKYNKSEKAMINCTLHLELYESQVFLYDFIGFILSNKQFICYYKKENKEELKDLENYYKELEKWNKENFKND